MTRSTDDVIKIPSSTAVKGKSLTVNVENQELDEQKIPREKTNSSNGVIACTNDVIGIHSINETLSRGLSKIRSRGEIAAMKAKNIKMTS